MTNESKGPTGSNTSSRLSWDETWMAVANIIGQRSQCSRAQVGCVVVDEDQQVLSASYNGPPPGSSYEGPCRMWCMRAMTGGTSPSYENCPSIHAEVNAIARMPRTTKSKTIYINRFCCFSCAKAIAAAGISRVVFQVTDIDSHLSLGDTEGYLKDSGITISGLEKA